MRLHLRRTLLALPLVALLACADDDEVLPAPTPATCEGSVAVQVTGVLTEPSIWWTPRCMADRIIVYQQVGGSTREVWHLRKLAGIAAGVRYGSAIPGATVVVEPAALTVGVLARAVVLMEVNGAMTPVGAQQFTP